MTNNLVINRRSAQYQRRNDAVNEVIEDALKQLKKLVDIYACLDMEEPIQSITNDMENLML